jgi:ATP-dependent Clp protease ATP-binding subunit ClpC
MSDEDQPAPTPRYRRVLANSTKVARDMGHSYVGVEHLFLAIIRDRDSVPTQVLAQHLDLDQVEAGLVQEMASPGYAGQAPANAVWFPQSELAERLAAAPPGSWRGWNVAGDQAWIAMNESAGESA